MEPTEGNLKQLVQLFASTLSDKKQQIHGASKMLKDAEPMPGFSVCLMRLLTIDVPQEIKLAAAVYLKNFVKKNWDPDTERDIIPAGDRETVKKHLVSLMISSHKLVQAQLSQTLGLISLVDFPKKWESLLPELISKFPSDDFAVLLGVLETANTIFHRYRVEAKSQRLWEELKYVLDNVQAPLLHLFQRVCNFLSANKNNMETLPRILQMLVLIVQIFHSLNAQDLPEFFEDHMKEWMGPFLHFLTFKANIPPKGDEPTMLEQLQTEVCEAIALYANKYEEEFNDFVGTFVQTVLTLVASLPDEERYDSLGITAIRFLTSVVKKTWLKQLFANPNTLQLICQRIVLPQIRIRKSEVELFESNGLEYVRRDMEGSDVDTRRRTTVDFVRGLCTHYEEAVSQILNKHIEQLLQEYGADGSRWAQKDVAMYITLALAAKGATRKGGITVVNPHVDVPGFIQKHVLAELQKGNDNNPILKADCLKFIAAFRKQLPAPAIQSLIPLLVKFLASKEFVIHTYAALAIEQLLSVTENGKPKCGKETVAGCVQPLLVSLFKALEHEDSRENDYIMKSIMQVCAIAEDALVKVAGPVMQRITQTLAEVAKNPRNPSFNHYLFETLACIIKSMCTVQASSVSMLESALFPPFQTMLSMQSCPEFGPYVFQLMAQLLEFRQDLSQVYIGMYPSLLSPALWDIAGNIPPITRLFKSYLRKEYQIVCADNRLEGILGVFQKLVGSKKWDRYGLQLLGNMIENIPMQQLGKYLPTVFALIFKRLQDRKTPQYVNALIVFFARFIHKHGLGAVVEATNQLQANIFIMFLEKTWIPALPSIISSTERKCAGVAMIDVLTRSPLMLQQPFLNLWGPLLGATVNLLTTAGAASNEVEDEEVEIDFSAAYAPLRYAKELDTDPFPQVGNLQDALLNGIRALRSQNPQQVNQLLSAVPSEVIKLLPL